MRIGIISTVGGYSWAGSEEMWKVIALAALKSGHEIAISGNRAIVGSQELEEVRSLGAIIFRRNDLGSISRRLASRKLYSRFESFQKWRPDLLCVSVGAPADPIWQPDLIEYLQSTDTPIVIIVQGNAEGLVVGEEQRQILRPLYRKSPKIIFVSSQNVTLLERQLAMSLPQATVLPNPIRIRTNQPVPWPQDLNEEVRFATVARFEVLHKCQDHTLEALSNKEWRPRNWSLSLFGTGPDEQYVRDLIKYYGLEDRVKLKGYVRDFREIWKDHHFHILNSHSEGLSLALIESMFCGRPSLVTRAGGNPELVRDGIDGFVSPGMHPEIVQETLEKAWQQKDLWQQFGLNAFHRASCWVTPDLGEQLFHTITNALKENSSLKSQPRVLPEDLSSTTMFTEASPRNVKSAKQN